METQPLPCHVTTLHYANLVKDGIVRHLATCVEAEAGPKLRTVCVLCRSGMCCIWHCGRVVSAGEGRLFGCIWGARLQ